MHSNYNDLWIDACSTHTVGVWGCGSVIHQSTTGHGTLASSKISVNRRNAGMLDAKSRIPLLSLITEIYNAALLYCGLYCCTAVGSHCYPSALPIK